MADTLFPLAAGLWFGAFAIFYFRVVPVLLTHDPSQPWGGLKMRFLSDLATYARLCESEAKPKTWYYLTVSGWLGGAGLFVVAFIAS